MSKITALATPDEPDEAKNGCSDDRALFAAAKARLAKQSSDLPAAPAPAEAIKAFKGLDNPVNYYLHGRSARPASMAHYERKIRLVAKRLQEAGFAPDVDVGDGREFPWHRITVGDADAFYRLINERYPSAKSRENHLGVLRCILKACGRRDLLDARTLNRLLEALPVRATPRQRVGRELSDDDIAALMDAARNHPNAALGARAAAMIAVLLSTGMRVSELVDLDLADYRESDQSLWLRDTKSKRPARVYLIDWAAQELLEWLEHRGRHAGPLFGKWPNGERLSAVGASSAVRRAVEQSGIDHIMTHDLRRTFITRLLRQGTDPIVVARLANHKNVSTTMVYDRRTEEEDREVVARLDLPKPDRQCRQQRKRQDDSRGERGQR